MNISRLLMVFVVTLAMLAIVVGCTFRADSTQAIPDVPVLVTDSIAAASPVSPTAPVKLIFIHHSTGGNWLADPNEDGHYGGLGQALMANNYFVSATNYGWGPPLSGIGEPVGNLTDIIHWPLWFTGGDSATVLSQLYNEFGKTTYAPGGEHFFGDYSRMADPDPTRENEIVMFKSCFPNSDLYGNPDDAAYSQPNDWEYSVSNAKAVYNELLTYFETRQDKLFVVITAPPMAEGEYPDDAGAPVANRAANARAFNNWLLNDWLASYSYNNVAVFDYYNVLTSNGSASRVDDPTTNEEPNDVGAATGNHHRWTGSAIEHLRTIDNNYAAYPDSSAGSYYDSHPTTAGHQKATAEFVPLLNLFYNRWKSRATPAQPELTLTAPTASTAWPVNSQQHIQWTTTPAGSVAQVNLYYSIEGVTTPLASAVVNSGDFIWTTPLTPTTSARVRVESVISSTTVFAVSGEFALYATGTLTELNHLPFVASDYDAGGSPPPSGSLVQPIDFVYLGAFRLPGGDTPPQTFAYGGNAMTFNPDGDPSNSDAYPGSLFVMGHDRQAWGDLPDGNQVAEISIPVPDTASDPADLPQADFIQTFFDVAAGFFMQLEEIPKAGMQYLNHADTGPRIHLAWGRHLQPDNVASHAWFNATLDTPNLQGVWFIGNQNLYSVNGYMFDIPSAWADAHVAGRYLATGRFRDGGQGGMGPALFAYRPWLAGGSAPISGTHLSETTLLLYENVYNTDDFVRNMNGYQHPDEWEGGAWITTPSGKSAVLFAGTKSNGTKQWYGYINLLGPEYPCVDEHVTDYVTCLMADGSSCPAEDFSGCCDPEQGTCVTYRGWWSTRFDAQFILYDPADLAQVAAGEIESWEPQPYALLDIDEHLYLDPPEGELMTLGTGVQRRYRIGAAAYDRSSGLLYVLELYADGAKPVVHVWKIR